MSSSEFLEPHRRFPRDFTRRRYLPVVAVDPLLLNQLKRSRQDELDAFFELVRPTEFGQQLVTEAAFSEARK